MNSYAVVNMAGNLTADPELRYSTNGDPVASFTVATSRVIKSEFNSQRWTSYIDCTITGEDAEPAAKRFKKGDSVEISGKLLQKRQELRGYKKSWIVVEVIAIAHAYSAVGV